MGNVTGPISSLPGAMHAMPIGTMCDEHPDAPAVRRVQGETDSFGCEMYDMCQACLDGHLRYRASAESRSGMCDWCKAETTDLRNTRDYDEGMYGSVYRVCGKCLKSQDDAARQELEEYEHRYGYLDDYDGEYGE